MPDGKPVDSSRPLSPYAAAEQINTLVNPSVLIVGAGIGGITLALDLDEKGLTNWLVGVMTAAEGGNSVWQSYFADL